MPQSRAGPLGSAAIFVSSGACDHLEDQLAHAEERLAARAARGVALAHAAQVEAGPLEDGRRAVEVRA